MKTQQLGKGPAVLSLSGSRLVVSAGPDAGRTLAIEKEEVVIGSAESADLVLKDPTVSRNHLAIRISPSGYLVTDLESTNGTQLLGRRIYAAVIEPGDELQLGSTRVRLESQTQRLDLPLSKADSFGRLRGRSLAARRLFAMLEAVAKRDVTVLLSGETGTGKDAAAESLHEASPRAKQSFVVLDCSAIPEGLMESELFGHEKGAFTGASDTRIGAFEEADGGTLFLDEIGELPKDLQPKLLRVLERREIRRVGSTKPRALDVRIIAATNRDLKVEVNRGLFREDLFYRLNVVSIRMPPLRERSEDIPLLVEVFKNLVQGGAETELPDELMRQFTAYQWPGNVRELRNRVERALVFPHAEDPTLASAPEGEPQAQQTEHRSYADAKTAAVDAFERAFLTDLVARSAGNTSEAARLASMDRVYLSKLLRKHGIQAGTRKRAVDTE
jgi:two-component system, NtrC family, response regulator GlrR